MQAIQLDDSKMDELRSCVQISLVSTSKVFLSTFSIFLLVSFVASLLAD